MVEGIEGDKAASDICTFETGKMEEKWEADWIYIAREDDFHPIIFKSFFISKKVKHARLYATGVGLFEAYVNREKLEKNS